MAMKHSHPLVHDFAANALLIDPSQADAINAALNFVVSNPESAALLNTTVQADAEFWGGSQEDQHPYRPYVVVDGVLQIPVQGVLLNRFSYQLGRWATGYQYIEKALTRGLADDAVSKIALIVHSGGGEVAGCFELADKIFEARGRKPIRAFAADYAYSAAYALASSAKDLVVSRSGGTGSVGVVTAHYDWSKALEQGGIKISLIAAGKHKVDGNPYEPLPDDVKARIQNRIDRIYAVFTGSVARNRGMEESAVRETEALTFDATESLEAGFADKIGAMDEEMVIFRDEDAYAEDEQMTIANPAAASFTQAQLDSAIVAARAEGMTAGATAEKARFTAILGSDNAKARPKAALAMAMKSGDPAEAVVSLLGDLPEEAATVVAPTKTEAPKAQTAFEIAMEVSGNPQVGADGGKADDEQPKMSVADTIFASAGYAPVSKTASRQ